jgi:hypothetical protein
MSILSGLLKGWSMSKKTITSGLGKPGKALIRPIIAEMRKNRIEPNAIEAAALRQAAALADRQAEMQALLEHDGGPLVRSARGARIHPATVEVRQLAVAITTILKGVSLIDNTSPASVSPRHAQAARVRWDREKAKNG